MKAYAVRIKGETEEFITWAKDRATAQQFFLLHIKDTSHKQPAWTDLRTRRAPEYDNQQIPF